MANTKRNKAERERDLILIAELYTKGRSYRQIAAEVSAARAYSLTHQQITYDVKHLLKEWRDDHKDKIDIYILDQLRKIDLAEAELWEAWSRSKEDFKKKTQKGTAAVKGKAVNAAGKVIDEKKIVPTESSITVEERNGNPAYMNLILSCVKQRSELLGLLKQKVEHSGAVETSAPPVTLQIVRKNGC